MFTVCSGVTVFEAMQKRKGDKRRRHRNNDAGDVEGYLGPWGKFVDEQTVMKPSEVDRLVVMYTDRISVLFEF